MHIAIGIDLVHMPGLREQLELPGSSFRRGVRDCEWRSRHGATLVTAQRYSVATLHR